MIVNPTKYTVRDEEGQLVIATESQLHQDEVQSSLNDSVESEEYEEFKIKDEKTEALIQKK